MSTEHFSSNSFNFPDPLPPWSLREVREFLDLYERHPIAFTLNPATAITSFQGGPEARQP